MYRYVAQLLINTYLLKSLTYKLGTPTVNYLTSNLEWIKSKRHPNAPDQSIKQLSSAIRSRTSCFSVACDRSVLPGAISIHLLTPRLRPPVTSTPCQFEMTVLAQCAQDDWRPPALILPRYFLLYCTLRLRAHLATELRCERIVWIKILYFQFYTSTFV